MLLYFLQLARELEEIIRRQTAEPAESCISNGGVSFLDQVISPMYEIIAAVSGVSAWSYFSLLHLVVLLLSGLNAGYSTGSSQQWQWASATFCVEKLWWFQWVLLVGRSIELLSSINLLLFSFFSIKIRTVLFRSPKCFQLGWPWKISNPFFSKPSRKEKVSFCWSYT